ncbi:cellobiose phosphorylase [Longilinea arvoryzae]|uniref:Cellobiose phosphorylase n=1 Tax=Longilinea arvoryzae TaxID=360412 RepID=A0A0S7BCM5_9CHLR|nr:hypothetical protein [Longilinea arvoryzae]GAP15596.1 cellobiose phosphorylase [Longilinea arvoryzae]
MNFGFFDDAHREYVITDPLIPVKWINSIGTPAFGGFVDHTGGALICTGDPRLDRITQYISQLPDSDFKGETLYLRMHSGDGRLIFSPFFVPTLTPMDHFECSVGQGYSRWRTEVEGLCCEVTVFIPLDAPVEIRDVSITNLRDDTVEVDAVPVVEYAYPDGLQFHTADHSPLPMQSSAQTLDGRTVLLQSPATSRERPVNYFTASVTNSSFETDRRAFLGANGYGSWQHPLALEDAELGNHQMLREDAIAALLLRLGALPPGESTRFATLLGRAADLQDARPIIQRYSRLEVIDAALIGLARP